VRRRAVALRSGTLVAAIFIVAFAVYEAYEALEAPANQLFGKTVVRGAPTSREVALTFDDGPNPPYTGEILDVLRRENARATFFVVGRAVVAYPEVTRRIVREGNAIGNHTWDHAHLIVESDATIRGELDRTHAAIERITGVDTKLMRPPFGARDFAVIGEAHKLGYRVVMWSVPLPRDWEQPGVATIVSRIVDNVADGSIIVLHDGNRGQICGARVPARVCDRSQEVPATREIVEILHRRGYRFVTIPQLIADAAAAPVTRTVARRNR
jgi:peptidoglycan/xylan/chitin deacetylase (PgdA/CDA1 family)